MTKATLFLSVILLLGATVVSSAETVTATSPREVRIAEGTKLCDQADKLLAEAQAQEAMKLYQQVLTFLPTSPRAKAGRSTC
ncbi:MAG: hypothetical protein ABFE08_16430 [Armatimonadia bacterium]